jgi:hypothetical protein
MQNYGAVYAAIEPFNGQVNFDRPMPESNDIDFMDFDYHEQYAAFKKHLRMQMRDEKYLLHTNIRDFAGSIHPNTLVQQMRDIGFDPESLAVIDRAFKVWEQTGVQGVIQGYGFTDIFLKMAMVAVDGAMVDSHPSCTYCRYVDDIVIAGDTQDDVIQAFQGLRNALGNQGLRVKRTATHLQHPNEAGHGHAYNIKRDMNRVGGDVSIHNIMNGRAIENMAPEDVLRLAYARFVKPSENRIDKPKYLTSHIMREMRLAHMPELAQDAKLLMDFYPQRAKKILKSALDCDPKVVMGMANYFFNDNTIDDPKWDSRRLDYLSVMRERRYAIPPYDVCVIQRSLETLSSRQPLFNAYKSEIETQYRRVKVAPSARSFSGPN